MNRKLMSLIMTVMLCVGIIGCSSEEEPTVDEKDTSKVEQPVEEKEVKEKKEEPVKDKKDFLTIENDEDFKHYLTSSLKDEEYDKYFDSLGNDQVVKFDANIVFIDQREGYDTRSEMLIYPGDYSETEVTGPAMKVKDIADYDIAGLKEKDSVQIVGTIWGYDEDQSYVDLHIESIELR